VVQEGEVGAGDQFECTRRDPHDVRVADITRLYVSERENVQLLRRAVAVAALAESWRGYFQHQLDKVAG